MCSKGMFGDIGGFSFVPVLWKRVDGMMEAWMTDMLRRRIAECPRYYILVPLDFGCYGRCADILIGFTDCTAKAEFWATSALSATPAPTPH